MLQKACKLMHKGTSLTITVTSISYCILKNVDLYFLDQLDELN